MIKAYWCLSTNFGDALTPYLIHKIGGEHPTFVNSDYANPFNVVTGSILNWDMPNAVVWGAGIAHRKDSIYRKDIRATRGLLTKIKCEEALGVNIPAYGDPALLLPEFYNPQIEVKYEIGIIPHYVDVVHMKDYSEYHIIDVLQPVEKVIDEILKCNIIFSSSLHGLIAAGAYGKKIRWIEFTGLIGGDGFKYRDYFSSVSGAIPECLNSKELRLDLSQRETAAVTVDPLLLTRLKEACPFWNKDLAKIST